MIDPHAGGKMPIDIDRSFIRCSAFTRRSAINFAVIRTKV